MKIKNGFLTIAGSALLSLSATASAASSMTFEQVDKLNVFSSVEGKTAYALTSLAYKDWLQKASGKQITLDIYPTLSGMAANVQTPPAQHLNESQPKGQEQVSDFYKIVNENNAQGRSKAELKDHLTAPQALSKAVTETQVIELAMSTVVNKPLSDLKFSDSQLAGMLEKIDPDNSHYVIPGTAVQDSLEDGSKLFSEIRPDRSYFLSVFDLGQYRCAGMKLAANMYFAMKPAKEQLHNSSIYVISQVDLNQPEVISQIEKYAGRKPDYVIQQRTILADHLIQGSKTIFAFYAEGPKTRILQITNLAMKRSFFEGKVGQATGPIILNGYTSANSAAGTALNAAGAAYDTASNIASNLLGGAVKDTKNKNLCDRGLALGLTRYTQSLFSRFVDYSVSGK